MASTLKHLRSSTADKRPTASGLVEGQLAINTASGTPALFFKDSNGGVVKVGPAHVGATAPNAVPAGSAGNSLGELWVDNSLTTAGLNYYTGSAFVNLTPSGTTTTVGLVELATPAETQTGTDAVRAVTPSGLQSKVSDSTSTTSSTTIASSTAVKSAYDLANAALPKAGGTVTGELLIGNTGSLVFEGSTDDSFETTIAVTDPTADRTITFPNITGTVVTTGDSGTVTSAMIANDTIVNADINSAAAIAYSKLALSSGIVNTDISASAAIVDTKLATISTADKVSLSALNIDDATDIGGPLEGGDLFIVDDGAGGTNRKASAFRMSQLAYSGVTGDIAIASGGTASISAGVIVNADVNSAAAIDFSKLASLTSANILLGNASNVATSTAVTGDVTISNAGVTAIAAGAIVDADVSASAEIAVSKLADGSARQLLQTDAAGTGVEWASNIDIPGTLDVTSAATFDSTIGASAGTASLPSITFTGDLNTGIYSPGADQVAVATNGSGRLFIGPTGQVGIAQSSLATGGFTAGTLRIGHATGQTAGVLLQNTSTATDSSFWYTDGTDSFLGSNNGYFAHFTGGTERLRITSAGLVGVGTSSPGYAFDCLAGSGSAVAARFRGNGGANNNTQIRFYGNNAAADQWAIGGSIATSDTGRDFHIYDLVANANRFAIDSSGRVGIGSTDVQSKLDVRDDSEFGIITIRRSTSPTVNMGFGINSAQTESTINYQTSSGLKFTQSGSEKARLDGSGRFLVGTSTARSVAGASFWAQYIEGTGSGAWGASAIINNNNDSYGPVIVFGKSRGATIGSNTVVVNGDILGDIRFCGADGSSLNSYGGQIKCEVDGTPGTSDMPGRLVFSTTADGASSPTERMRIRQTGQVNIVGDGLTVESSAAAGTTAIIMQGRYGATLGSPLTGTVSIYVWTNGNIQNTNNSYTGISDVKLKENIVDATSQWDDIKALQVRKYNFKEGQTHTQIGLIAQEVERVSPGLVTESPDLDEDGNDLGTVTKGVNYSVLYMKAVKALQEAMERIEQLEAKVAALEAA